MRQGACRERRSERRYSDGEVGNPRELTADTSVFRVSFVYFRYTSSGCKWWLFVLVVLFSVHSQELVGVVATEFVEGVAATLRVRWHRLKCLWPFLMSFRCL